MGLVHGCDEVGIRYTNVNSRAVGKRMSRNGKLGVGTQMLGVGEKGSLYKNVKS